MDKEFPQNGEFLPQGLLPAPTLLNTALHTHVGFPPALLKGHITSFPSHSAWAMHNSSSQIILAWHTGSSRQYLIKMKMVGTLGR